MRSASGSYRLKLESSPNGRAKCRCCCQRIQKGQQRLSITKDSRTVGSQGRAQYYHKACLIRSKSDQTDPYFWRALREEMLRSQEEAMDHPIRRWPSDIAPEVIEIDDSDDENHANTNNTAFQQNQSGENDADDDDDIVCEETLTNAQVIQQKFDRAAANGEIVSID